MTIAGKETDFEATFNSFHIDLAPYQHSVQAASWQESSVERLIVGMPHERHFWDGCRQLL